MIDALKRHPQCENMYRCLVFKEIRILYIKESSPNIKVLSSQEEEEEEEEEQQQRRALLEQRSLRETLLKRQQNAISGKGDQDPVYKRAESKRFCLHKKKKKKKNNVRYERHCKKLI